MTAAGLHPGNIAPPWAGPRHVDLRGAGVPPWMDPDWPPWLDECTAADAAQDQEERFAAVAGQYTALMTERFGDPAPLATEVGRGPVRPIPAGLPPRHVVADPASLVDHDVVCAARRRLLNDALEDRRVTRPAKGEAA